MILESDLSLIYKAIQKEQAENPFCPVVINLYAPLLKKINQGDREALHLAIEIAHDSLTPRKPFFSFLNKHK